jgi:hypothetical protein
MLDLEWQTGEEAITAALDAVVATITPSLDPSTETDEHSTS